MKKWLVLSLTCLALGLAACGDDDDDESAAPAKTDTTAQQQPAETTAEEQPEASGEPVTVDMKDIKFVPENVTVKVGTTVKWTNSDEVPHTVTKEEGPGAEFDSGNVAAGEEFEHTFDAAGEVKYVCEIHPGQEGTVTVE